MKKFTAFLLTLLMVFTLIPAFSFTSAEPDTSVTIDLIEVTDFHGALTNASNQKIGSVLARHIKEIRENNPDGTLVLGGGDMFQGTSVSNILKGVPVNDWMNYCGFDVLTVGNHEFDWGLDTFEYTTTATATYKVVANNITWKEAGVDGNGKAHEAGERRFDSYAIVEKNGVKIAVIGSIADGIESAIAENTRLEYNEFGDVAECFKQTVAQMEADGAEYDCIISLIHGSGRSLTAIAALADEYPIVAVYGGHSHGINTQNFVTEGGKTIPYYVSGANGGGYTHTSFTYDTADGSFSIPEAEDADYTSISAKNDANGYNCSAPNYDEGAQKIVDDALTSETYTTIANEIIGYSSVDLKRRTAGLNRWTCIAIAEDCGATVGFTNSGGLRCDLVMNHEEQSAAKGNIPFSLIYQYMPFDNFVYTCEITYTQFYELMEDIASNYTGLLAGGVRYVYDSSKDKGSRLVKITKEDGSSWDADDKITIAVPDFVLNGGDNFFCFRNYILVPANEATGQEAVSIEDLAMETGYTGKTLRDALANDLRNTKDSNGDYVDLSTRLDMTPYRFDIKNVTAAKALLAETAVSTDGEGLAVGSYYAPQEAHDALTALVAAFENETDPTKWTDALTAVKDGVDTFKAARKTVVNTLAVAFLTTTDMHGRSAKTDVATAKEDVNSMVRVASIVAAQRELYNGNTLVVDTGDTFQGNLLAQYAATIKSTEENPMTEALKYIDYDAFVQGNHEFNYLPGVRDTQMKLLDEAGIAILAANLTLVEEGVNFKGETVPAGSSFYTPYTLKTFTNEAGNTATVAVIGITNANCDSWDSTQNFPNLKFYSDGNEDRKLEAEIQKWVDHINANEDVDCIVVAAHTGAGSNSWESQANSGAKNSSGIAVLTYGHDHSPRLTTVTAKDGKTVYLMNGGGSNVAKAELLFSFDGEGKLVDCTVTTEQLSLSDATVDETLATALEPWYTEAREWASTPVGSFSGGWSDEAIQAEAVGKTDNDMVMNQTQLMNLINKAQIWATWQSYESKGIEGATVSMASPVFGKVNGKLSFVPKDGDTVSLLDVSKLYRYSNNLLCAFDMTGEQLYAWMSCVADMYNYNAETGKVSLNTSIYGVDTFYGVDYAFDITRPKGSRLLYAKYEGEDLVEYEGLIRVALNSYRVGGGYGFYEATGLDGDDTVWTASEFLGDNRAPVPTLICEYIGYMKTVTPYDKPYAGNHSNWEKLIGYQTGDADMDGDVDSADAAEILRCLVELVPRTVYIEYAGDVDENKGLTAADAACILRWLVDLIPTLPANLVDIRVLATSDIHGQLYPTDYTKDVADSGTYNRSLAHVATYVKTARAESDNVLLVDAGDFVQGTPLTYYYAFYKADVVDPGMLALRTMGYDMFVPGNHEFNYGMTILSRQLNDLTAEATATEAQVSVSCANYLAAATNNDETRDWATWNDYAPYVIKNYDGVRVAVMGMGNPNIPKWDVPANWEGIYFAGVVETYKHYEAEMLEKADIIVLVSHSGIDSSPTDSDFVRELIEQTSSIDLVISGHEHKNGVTKINNSEGETVCVMSPYTKGRAVGDAGLTYNKETDELTVTAAVKGTSALTADAALVELLDPYETATWNDYMLKPIGTATADFPAKNLGTAPSAFMDLINRVQLWGAYDRTGENTPDDTSDDTMAQLSISAPLTSGDAANLIPAGDILLGDMFKLYRYENWFYQITMSGKEVRTWLEFAATKIYTNEAGNITSVDLTYYDVIYGEGFSYVIDYLAEEGSRIISMTYNGVEVADDAVFTVVVNNYRYNGGGNYVKYLNDNGCDFKANDPDRIIYSTQYDMIQGEDKGQARNLLADYITAMGSITPDITSTWSLKVYE